jgi:REP element-mobilizing transposase RayT
MKRMGHQLAFDPPRRGGPQPGAGRKPKHGVAGVSHLARPVVKPRFPVHVTLRIRREVWNLRSRRCFTAIRRAFVGGRRRFGFRLNEFSVQGNHVHLIAEADGNVSLSRGMQGLTIRVAKALNRVMQRRGTVFADRYHLHVLRTPAEVRNALSYVLNNDRKHLRSAPPIDPFSSIAPDAIGAIVPARTWLQRTAFH